MKDTEKLVEIFDKHLDQFEALIKKVDVLEARVIELEEIIHNNEIKNGLEIESINETIAWFSKEAEKAVKMASDALYYAPKTAEQVEEIIHNKVVGKQNQRIKEVVKAEMDGFKWQLSEFFRD